jgi:hypothetical protein
MRFDDTNPVKEDQEYVDSILDAVHWLGFDWQHTGASGPEQNLYYASDYFERLYQIAEYLIGAGHAYVDSQSAEEMREGRGTLTEPGRDSPFRNRPADESLELLQAMRAGKHPEGSHIVRARIDMASPNMNLRDPAHLPDPVRRAPPHRQPMVHLSDVRLRASACRTRSRTSPIRSARWSSRTIARCTTGCWNGSAEGGFFSAAAPADRIRASQPHLHHHQQAQAPGARGQTAGSTAGTIRACRPSSGCGVAATRRSRFSFVCRAHRRVEGGLLDRHGRARADAARRPRGPCLTRGRGARSRLRLITNYPARCGRNLQRAVSPAAPGTGQA